jgi:hypothetical protein
MPCDLIAQPHVREDREYNERGGNAPSVTR